MARKNSPVSRRVLVVVKRDMTAKTPRVIWQHEKLILEAIFGEGSVEDVDPNTMDEGYTAKVSPELLVYNKRQDGPARPSVAAGIGYVFKGDPAEEYQRLVGAYGRHVEKPMPNVEYVYGRFQEGRFESLVGNAEYSDMPEAQLREIARGFGYVPFTSKESSEAEKNEAAEAAKRLREMPREDLVKLVEDLAGEYA